MGTACPVCEAAIGGDSRFCPACGARLLPASLLPRFSVPRAYTPPHLAERILALRSALQGERKRVTVMFCDVVGSTPLAERVGPEATYELFNEFFELALAEVHRYEGTVNQFLGDGFMALFGAPIALEQHERHAVLAAVNLRRRVGVWTRQTKRPEADALALRIALNTGLVVVGRIGDNLRMDYTAVGDTTNVAARLQAAAEPGSILLSSTTYDRARGLVQAESLGHIPLKGKALPIEVFRVLDLRPSRSPDPGPETRRLSPFVGRRREMASLQEALAEAEASRGGAVGIVGEPGLGKSRLLLEFRHALAGRRLTLLEARCVPYGTSIPYLPVIDLLRANCGLVDLDTPEEATAKVRRALEEVGLEPGDHVPYLLHLLGLKEDGDLLDARGPQSIKTRTVDSLAQLIVSGSRKRPLVLVVEDLHWIDQASEEFIGELADRLSALPILLVVTYRPGYTPPWINRSYVTQVALRSLSDPDSRQVLASVLHEASVDQAVTEDLLRRGEGNPFFLEELGRAVSVEPGAEIGRLPDTVQGVLAARLDRLPDEAKRLLQVASVIGREFAVSLLSSVWEGSEPLDVLLRQLARLEFLQARLLASEPTYAFSHALTQETAYGSLLESRRRLLHEAVGRALETRHADRTDEVVELLAHHFVLSADAERAVDYALGAAAKAQRRWANAEAMTWFERARARLDALTDTAANRRRRIDVGLKPAEVRFALGQHAQQIEALQAIQDLVETDADPPRRAAWHYWLGFLHSLTGSHPRVAIEHCERAVRIAEAEALGEIEAHARSCLAQISLFTGDLRAGIALGERAIAAFEERGNLWWAGRTLGHLVPIANALGEWERGLAYGRRVLTHASVLDDQRLRIMGLLRLASTLIQRGDTEEGLRLCDEAAGLAPGPFDAATVRAIRGHGLVRAGQLPAGTALLGEVLEWLERSHLRYTHCQIAVWLAEAHLRAGARDRARPVLTGALETVTTLGYRHLEGVVHRLLAECLGTEDAADLHLDAALARLREIEAPVELARALVLASTRARRRGRSAEALVAGREALVFFERLGLADEADRVRTMLEDW